jgi:hypothetical protein
MDWCTYKFNKLLYKEQTNVLKRDIEEIKYIVKWLKEKGFVIYNFEKPMTVAYERNTIIPNSFFVEFSYDVGPKLMQFITVSICNNERDYGKNTHWSVLLEDGFYKTLGKGEDFEILKSLINSIPCFRVKSNNMFEMLKSSL